MALLDSRNYNILNYNERWQLQQQKINWDERLADNLKTKYET